MIRTLVGFLSVFQLFVWQGTVAWSTDGKSTDGKLGVASAQLKNSKGEVVGSAMFQETGQGVRISLNASGLPPGKHGIHFHEKGSCVGPDFKSAGEHLNPLGKEHGLKSSKGAHAGDLPNLVVPANGAVRAEFFSDRITLKDGANNLLKAGGTALVIHAQADDQKTSPTGGSGARILCGEVKALS
ncbi:MAG: hypothetical protein A2428_17675 [Bdellovibrionales bacterium RIFOXYC1_FULL_54_43]|nr:MAG: hypothetical protein A2428_17675 [Bdellovibrionales bacterium RIFOXYC1_FULL_54_43]OFZ79202.1 MAG: hypothetical protein A2603_03990 [Bdellovibrionales bacterium RIFOXYD1_FULL_55_31]